MDWNLVSAVCAVLVATVGCTWGLQAYMGKQFGYVRALVYEKTTELLKKLEYHEEHDDRRFADIENDIWLIRLRNAADRGLVDGTTDPSKNL